MQRNSLKILKMAHPAGGQMPPDFQTYYKGAVKYSMGLYSKDIEIK